MFVMSSCYTAVSSVHTCARFDVFRHIRTLVLFQLPIKRHLHSCKDWNQTRAHTQKAYRGCSFHKANTLTMVLNACCSCCCCMSRAQAAHSPWQSLRPGVKRHASSTTRYHRGIFIAQHSQTEEGQTGAQKLEEKFLKWGSPAGETGAGGRQHLQGPAYREKADSSAYSVNTNSQGSLAGFGRSVQALVSGTSSANGRRERTCVWDGEKAQLEEMSEKNEHMSVGRKSLLQDGGVDDWWKSACRSG